MFLSELPTANSNFYDFFGYGQRQSNCCISWLIQIVLNVFPTFSAATTKDDNYDREGHR